MSWLYDERIVTALFLALIVATPAVAIAGGAVHHRLAHGLPRRTWVLWIVLALVGPLNYGFWRLYNLIEDHWGLDRVEPLLINFAFFIFLGVAIGLVLRFLLRPAPADSERPPRDTEKP